jgi:hypothetical protein
MSADRLTRRAALIGATALLAPFTPNILVAAPNPAPGKTNPIKLDGKRKSLWSLPRRSSGDSRECQRGTALCGLNDRDVDESARRARGRRALPDCDRRGLR